MLCAMLGCRPSPFSASLKSTADFCVQASNWLMSMSWRTGKEPLFWLNTVWNRGSRATLAKSFWALMSFSFLSLNIASESML
ncbi:hypothetical protein D3C85_1266650 [compost metagenome]